jgi:hypothetical protein
MLQARVFKVALTGVHPFNLGLQLLSYFPAFYSGQLWGLTRNPESFFPAQRAASNLPSPLAGEGRGRGGGSLGNSE